MQTFYRGTSAFADNRRAYLGAIPDQDKTGYRMVHDPSGTIRSGALFTRNDVRYGADLGAWEDGVIFQHIHSKKLMTWSRERGWHTPGAQRNGYPRR